MRHSEFLNEMPIRIHNGVSSGNSASSFRSDDRTLLNSEKAIAKIKRVWHSSVVDVDLFTLDMKIDSNTALNIALYGYDYLLTPDHNEEIASLANFKAPEFDSNAISVILTNNDGANRIPLTGWIIAHRLYHCFQSDRETRYHTANSEHLGPNLMHLASTISKQFGGLMFDLDNYCVHPQSSGKSGTLIPYLTSRHLACLIGSTKSCRDFNLISHTEFIPECFAQYMLRGKVSFRTLPHEPFEIEGAKYSPTISQYKYCQKIVDQFETFLNQKFAMLVNAARGRVVAL